MPAPAPAPEPRAGRAARRAARAGPWVWVRRRHGAQARSQARGAGDQVNSQKTTDPRNGATKEIVKNVKFRKSPPNGRGEIIVRKTVETVTTFTVGNDGTFGSFNVPNH